MRGKKEKTPPFKGNLWVKSKYTPFFTILWRTLSHEKYPSTGHFGNTHVVRPFSEWGGRGLNTSIQRNTIVLFVYPAVQFSSAVCIHTKNDVRLFLISYMHCTWGM